MKKIVVVLLVLVCGLATMSYANGVPSPKISYKCASQYKKQAKTLAQDHQWISFKCRDIHYWNGEEGWDAVISVIIKYDEKNPLVFMNVDDEKFHLLTKDSYKRINDVRLEITDITRNSREGRDLYENIGVYGSIASVLSNVSYFLYPVDFVNTMAIRPFFKSCSEIEIDGKSYNRYESFFMQGENIVSFVNNENNILDSVYLEYHSKDGDEGRDYYNIFDVRFEDRRQYIDSVFNFNNPKYVVYSKYDEYTYPIMMSNTDNLTNDILNFPLVNLHGDTTTLSKNNGWLLLNFWSIGCGPCLKGLEKYQHEKDSLGYRVLENQGIKILAIEHKSNNMERIGNIADKMQCGDIMYSAKGIGTKINIPTLGFYYLISPDKKIAGKYGELDYDKVLKAKQNHETK